jgi:hypothetical protein
MEMMEFVPEGVLLNTVTNRRRTATEGALAEAMQAGEAEEARAVLCDGEHNLHVEFPCMKGIVPYEEGALGIAEGTTRDIALISRVSKPVCVLVTGFEELPDGTRRAICSRRAAQQRCRTEYIDRLHRGDIIPGTIIIAFRLNKRGSVETMNLITRRGASVIQQSFTFGAIRQAQLPPMPPCTEWHLGMQKKTEVGKDREAPPKEEQKQPNPQRSYLLQRKDKRSVHDILRDAGHLVRRQ